MEVIRVKSVQRLPGMRVHPILIQVEQLLPNFGFIELYLVLA